MAKQLGSILLIVVVVGGLGSLPGAFIASLVIGCLQVFAISTDLKFGDLVGGLTDLWGATTGLGSEPVSRLAPLVPYLLMLVLLVLRPRGLMGRRDV